METKKQKEFTPESIVDFLIERNYANSIHTYDLVKDDKSYRIKYKSLSTFDYGELKLKCRTATPQGNIVLDETRFYCEVIAKCCIEPNFNDTSLLSKANCTTPVQFVSTMFAPLEIEIIAEVILTNSGVDDKTIDKSIEQVKKL